MKKIIINADDFGFSEGINKAILHSSRKGIVTSTSIVGNIKPLLRVKRELRRSRIGKGVHINLTLGNPLLSREEIPSLYSYSGFHESLNRFIIKSSFGLMRKKEIEEEIKSQIDNVREIADVDHLDSHQHVHILPAVYPIVLKLAKKYSIPFVRFPYQNINPSFFNRLGERVFLNTICMLGWNQKNAYRTKIRYFCGFWHGGLSLDLLEGIASSLGEGACELMCHPSYSDSFIMEKWPSLQKERCNDFYLLNDIRAARTLKSNGIKLARFSDL